MTAGKRTYGMIRHGSKLLAMAADGASLASALWRVAIMDTMAAVHGGLPPPTKSLGWAGE